MKNSFVIISSLLLVCAAALITNGQAKSTTTTSSSLLYKVTGNGLKNPSYIFGTFHAICPTEMVPLKTLEPFLDQTDQLFLEIDMDDPGEMAQMGTSILIPGGKTLKDLLTPQEFEKVDAMVKAYLGYPAENVKMVKPYMLAVLAITSPKAIGCTPNIYDMSLMQNAVEKKKPVIGLETVASQIKVIDSKPLDKQAKELYEMALKPDESISEIKKLMVAYAAGDAEKLFELTTAMMEKDKEFGSRLLDERNIAWIPKLETAFKEKPTFVAFGAGHLGGKTGVIKLLRVKGYQVESVKLSPKAAGGN